jgi:hypothetical protein
VNFVPRSAPHGGTLMREAGVLLKRAQQILEYANERTTLAI